MALPINIPLPTLKRYSYYINILLKVESDEWVSTSYLSRETGVKPITIRKDLGYLGVKGIPQKGFPLKVLVEELKSVLGGDSFNDLVLIGSWGFGGVYKEHPELLLGDFTLRVLFDFVDREDKSGPIPVYPINRLEDLIPRLGVSMVILSVEPKHVDKISRELFKLGIRGILNLTNVDIETEGSCHSVRFNPIAPISELLGVMKS